MTETTQMLLAGIFVAVAFLYASVGHGGASGYLAVMALFSVPSEVMKPVALVMNLAVSALAFLNYYRAGHFKVRLLLPFAVTSIPCAFLGSTMTPEGAGYERLLACVLLISAVRLSGFFGTAGGTLKAPPPVLAWLAGALIGWVSGMIGVGGGILLSPLLLWMHWAGMKETAAVSAPFIFLNSAAALLAMIPGKLHFEAAHLVWLIAVVAGGMAGSYVGSSKWNSLLLKRILALVLAIASVKLLGFSVGSD